MSAINLFLLFPETNPTCQFINSNEPFQFHESVFESFVNDLNEIVKGIKIENYFGFYDSKNIDNFLSHFRVLEDLYPATPFVLLSETIKDWDDWRENVQQSGSSLYEIFNQKITDNTFCEIAERKIQNTQDFYPLLNQHALSPSMKIEINVKNQIIKIDNLLGFDSIQKWFSLNRVPKRNFHVSPKHGENRSQITFQNGEKISPLRCSEQEAQQLLNTAIGVSIIELFQFDSKFDEVIVFKFENNNPQNLYHGYHVSKASSEIPNAIRKRLNL